MNKLITISLSPHVHSPLSTSKLMTGVLVALIPAFAVALWMFGWGVLIITAVSVVSSVIFEYLIQKYLLKKEATIGDGSAMVTGVLLAFTLPANLPLWMVVIGALIAIGVGKMTFGGIGNNPFNPALVGRVFLFISFPVQMTNWPVPQGFKTSLTDAVTGATPLGVIKEGLRNSENLNNLIDKIPTQMQMFYGHMGGERKSVV